MLVPFVVESEALSGERNWTPRELRSHLSSMLDTWKCLGILVYDGENRTGSNFWSAIRRGLRDCEFGLWKKVAEGSPALFGGDKWSGELQESGLQRLALVAGICVSSLAKAEELASAAGSVAIDLRTLFDFKDAEGVQDAKELAVFHIKKGELREDVWSRRFKCLAASTDKCVKSISIVDPYTVERFVVKNQQELPNFLSLVNSAARSRKNVTVYAKWPYRSASDSLKARPVEQREIISTLSAFEAELRNIGSLTLQLASGKGEMHDRFVAFGKNYVWDLGQGLVPFEDIEVSKDCSAHFKTWELARTYNEILDRWLGLSDIPMNHTFARVEIWNNR